MIGIADEPKMDMGSRSNDTQGPALHKGRKNFETVYIDEFIRDNGWTVQDD